MKRRTAACVVAVIGIAVTGLGGVAVAGSGEDGEAGSTAFTPEQADAATEAALAATGGGTADGVERDSENGATWEVEVTKADGSDVDVRLDESYGVVVIESDGESGDDD